MVRNRIQQRGEGDHERGGHKEPERLSNISCLGFGQKKPSHILKQEKYHDHSLHEDKVDRGRRAHRKKQRNEDARQRAQGKKAHDFLSQETTNRYQVRTHKLKKVTDFSRHAKI
jgi:hypothetical protein